MTLQIYKYPRTFHLPWSPGRTSDDKVLSDTKCFKDKHIVVSIKMDGENTTMYNDHIHARSVDSKDHPSRHWVKGLWARKRYLIPEGWRVCGENLFARHSITYDDLESYFLVFSIWRNSFCLPYWETRDLCDSWGFSYVPIIYNGFWLHQMEEFLDQRFSLCAPGHEGYVIRNYSGFDEEYFDQNVAKYVRQNHVQTSEHWLNQPVVPNKCKK